MLSDAKAEEIRRGLAAGMRGPVLIKWVRQLLADRDGRRARERAPSSSGRVRLRVPRSGTRLPSRLRWEAVLGDRASSMLRSAAVNQRKVPGQRTPMAVLSSECNAHRGHSFFSSTLAAQFSWHRWQWCSSSPPSWMCDP